MKYPFFITILLLFTLSLQAQRVGFNKAKINFTEVWVWEYTDINGNKTEMAIYREPKLNYWLLTSETYGSTDEMCDWIILKPDGICYFAYKNAELDAGKTLLKMKMDVPKIKTMPLYWRKTGKRKFFGDKSLGFPRFNGIEYTVSYLKTKEKSSFYLANTNADFMPLSYFNDLETDAKMPISFPKDIPSNKVVLSEKAFGLKYSVGYSFKYISHTEYHINFSE